MICNICHKEITSTQMRHSSGSGNYHMACEFNETRKQLGMLPFEKMKNLRYVMSFDDIRLRPHR